MDRTDDAKSPNEPKSASPIWPILAVTAVVAIAASGFLAYAYLNRRVEPPPPVIEGDPLLARGHEIYLERCLSCHGPSGKGDGPLAAQLPDPKPRNLAEDHWKHGDGPEQVVGVIANGVKDAQMPGWSGTYGPDDIKAVAAYVYLIAGKPVPEALRKP